MPHRWPLSRSSSTGMREVLSILSTFRVQVFDRDDDSAQIVLVCFEGTQIGAKRAVLIGWACLS